MPRRARGRRSAGSGHLFSGRADNGVSDVDTPVTGTARLKEEKKKKRNARPSMPNDSTWRVQGPWPEKRDENKEKRIPFETRRPRLHRAAPRHGPCGQGLGAAPPRRAVVEVERAHGLSSTRGPRIHWLRGCAVPQVVNIRIL